MEKKLFLPALLAVAAVTLSGCGMQLTRLSDDDQSRFISYCAQVVAKHNANNETGLISLPKKEETGKKDDTDPSEDKSDLSENTESQSSSETASSNEVKSASFTEAIGIGGMRFDYRDARVAGGYSQGDVYSLKADSGKELLFVRIKAVNTTKKSINIDMPSQNIIFTASYKDQSVNSDMTLLMNDLTTFQGKFAAGKRRNMILLFQFPKGSIKDPKKVSFSVKKGNETVTIDK